VFFRFSIEVKKVLGHFAISLRVFLDVSRMDMPAVEIGVPRDWKGVHGRTVVRVGFSPEFKWSSQGSVSVGKPSGVPTQSPERFAGGWIVEAWRAKPGSGVTIHISEELCLVGRRGFWIRECESRGMSGPLWVLIMLIGGIIPAGLRDLHLFRKETDGATVFHPDGGFDLLRCLRLWPPPHVSDEALRASVDG